MSDVQRTFAVLGVKLGVLAGILCFLAALLPADLPVWLRIATWPAFISWALFYAHGAHNVDSSAKVMAGNLFGVLVGCLVIVALTLAGQTGFGAAVAMGVVVFLAAFVLVFGASWDPIGFIPASFCGCAGTFAAGISFVGSDGSWAVGLGVQAAIALVLSFWIGIAFAVPSNIWGSASGATEESKDAVAA